MATGLTSKEFGNSCKIDQELKHFQKHNFEKANIYIIDFIDSEEDTYENVYICKVKTIYPYGLNLKLMVKITVLYKIFMVCLIFSTGKQLKLEGLEVKEKVNKIVIK